MPLALSRTARTLNSWTPNGSLKDCNTSPPSDPVIASQKASSKWKVPVRKGSQAMRSVTLQAIAMNLKPFRQNSNYKGFAQEPKPKVTESPLMAVPVTAQVQSPTNRNVHFGTERMRRTSLQAGCPVQSLRPDASLHCASALLLGTGRSPQSIGHLRKWNSQDHLAFTTQEGPCDSELRTAVCSAFRRSGSLLDLSQREPSDAVGLLKNCPKPPDSPSDTGRALCFWLEGQEGTKELNPTRAMFYVPGLAQIVTKGQSELLTLGPQLLAQELTQLAKELLLAVETSELLVYVIKPRIARIDTCPNLHRLFRFYDRLCSLVTTEILRNQSPSERAQTIALFIEMANQCERLQNWQSCVTLLSGIRSPPIVRLRDTWYQLRVDFPDHFQMFERLLLVSYGESGPAELNATPRPMAAVSYFGEIVSRARVLPTDHHPILTRSPWKEPPSLAEWVAEQTMSEGEQAWEECQSFPNGNPASRYLKAFVLGKNLFCPVEKMARISRTPSLKDQSEAPPADDNTLQRLNLTQHFEDPDALPFASPHVQCCALQPFNLPQVRQRVEVILRSAQAAARAYDLQSDPSCRRFWLQHQYCNQITCMKRSLLLERPREGKTKLRPQEMV